MEEGKDYGDGPATVSLFLPEHRVSSLFVTSRASGSPSGSPSKLVVSGSLGLAFQALVFTGIPFDGSLKPLGQITYDRFFILEGNATLQVR